MVKNENLKKIFFCSFCVIMSLHARNCVCSLACGQYKKTKRKQLRKQLLKGPKNVKKINFEKRKELIFLLS